MRGRLRVVALLLGLVATTVALGFLSVWAFSGASSDELTTQIGALAGGVVIAAAAAYFAFAAIVLGWALLAFGDQ